MLECPHNLIMMVNWPETLIILLIFSTLLISKKKIILLIFRITLLLCWTRKAGQMITIRHKSRSFYQLSNQYTPIAFTYVASPDILHSCLGHPTVLVCLFQSINHVSLGNTTLFWNELTIELFSTIVHSDIWDPSRVSLLQIFSIVTFDDEYS